MPSSGVVAVVLTEAVSTCKQRVMSRKNHPTLPPVQSSLGIVDGMRRAWQVGVCVLSLGIASGFRGDLLVFQVKGVGCWVYINIYIYVYNTLCMLWCGMACGSDMMCQPLRGGLEDVFGSTDS